MAIVAVLGGGSTGMTIAADLTLKGHSVRLYDNKDHFENLAQAQAIGTIRMEGRAANGAAKVELITDELSSAVDNAEVIMVAMVANRHTALVEELAPLLVSGQTVCFSAGNCGSILLRNKIGKKSGVLLGEMLGNVYPCRIIAPAVVTCAFPYAPKKASAFPAQDTEKFIHAMEAIYPCIPAKNVFETALNSPSMTIHLAGSLLNAGAIEQNPEFRLYKEGLTPAILACMEQVEDEKCRVLDHLGLEGVRHCTLIKKLMKFEEHPELSDFRMVSGPNSMNHRYVSEDAFSGHALLITLAHQFGIPVPCMEALETLAGVINGVDYLAVGNTVKRIGVAGMSPDEITRYLEFGQKGLEG